MPLLFAFGQHGALQGVQNTLETTERLLAFLDDVYTVSPLSKCICTATRTSGRSRCGMPAVFTQGLATPFKPSPQVQGALSQCRKDLDWSRMKKVSRCSELRWDMRISWRLIFTWFGKKHQTLLERIPVLQDIQSAWTLLLHSASSRANYQLRVVRPELTEQFAAGHDEGVWRCLCAICQTSQDMELAIRDTMTLPLRRALRTRQAAYWASLGGHPLHGEVQTQSRR